MYLIFETKEYAEQANATISQAMGFHGDVTAKWAEPRETIDGKYCFVKPDDRFMNGLTGYTEAETVEFPVVEIVE